MTTNDRRRDPLGEALGAWKRARKTESGLSQATRERIVQTAWSESRARGDERFHPTFAPKRWFAGLAAASLVLVGTVAILMQGDPRGDAPARLMAEKVGDQVVFTIANGHRSHSVRKATDPSLLERAEAVRVQDGRYFDAADDEAAIVFYRVD